ncbi:MAG: exo-alpha-sialidase, partial [Saprospiraceae bacterium]|nr:exo-alpha-sialidase [Saprospiraceae bacterium]
MTRIFFFLSFLICYQVNGQEVVLSLSDSVVPVFVQGESGYACFRIPATIKLANHDLIAFAEGRKKGCSDTGDIDLVMKRSKDRGKTWGELQKIWDDQANTCGNPA